MSRGDREVHGDSPSRQLDVDEPGQASFVAHVHLVGDPAMKLGCPVPWTATGWAVISLRTSSSPSASTRNTSGPTSSGLGSSPSSSGRSGRPPGALWLSPSRARPPRPRLASVHCAWSQIAASRPNTPVWAPRAGSNGPGIVSLALGYLASPKVRDPKALSGITPIRAVWPGPVDLAPARPGRSPVDRRASRHRPPRLPPSLHRHTNSRMTPATMSGYSTWTRCLPLLNK